MNKVTLVGRLTKDVEVNKGGKGDNAWSVARVTLAIRDGKDADGEERTQFVSCTCWNGLADVLKKYASKGDRVGIAGRLVNNNYADEDGEMHYTMDVVASEVELLESKKDKKGGEDKKSKKTKAKSKKASRKDEDEDEDEDE